MTESILIGAGFALAAAIQPGPLQAFLFSSVTRQGWKQTLPAAFAPVLSDGPIAVVVLLIINRLPETMTLVLQSAGGFLLFYLAWSSLQQWRAGPNLDEGGQGSVPKTVFQAVMVNLLNPNPYLGWSLVLGPAAINAWSLAPIRGIVLVAAFYFVLVLSTMGVIVLFGLSGFLDVRRRHFLILLSAIILAILGSYQLRLALIGVLNLV
ncbi:MAG: LysE family transporter [Anaerolineales bacterium]